MKGFKSQKLINYAIMLAVLTLFWVLNSSISVKAYDENPNFLRTQEEVKASVLPVGSMIKDKDANKVYKIINPFNPSLGYFDSHTGEYFVHDKI